MKPKTRIVPSSQAGYGPGRYVVQFWDSQAQVWFDLGDPHDTEADADVSRQRWEENE